MARQSRWQQFANNFNATYNTVTGVARDFESAKVMRNEFEDEEGNPLTGDALRQRRTQGLADIYTKYGDAEGALGLLSSQEQLRSSQLGNEITEATKDDVIAQPRLANDVLRARAGALSRRGGGRSRRPSDADLFSQAVTGALAQFEGGATGAANDSAPEQTDAPPSGFSDAPPRRSAPGLSAPNTPSSLPAVSGAGAPPRQESRAVPGDLPMSPTLEVAGVSSRGIAPGQGRQADAAPQTRVAGLNTANDASPSRPQQGGPKAQTSAPTQPGLAQTIADRRMEVEAKNKPLPKSYQKRKQQEADQSGEFLMSLAEQFRVMGRPEWVDKTIRLYEQRGEIESARILADTQRTQAEMQVALQQDGSFGGIALIDKANGDARDLEMEAGEDGNVVVMEYFKDENGERVGKRPLMTAANEEELQAKLWAWTKNPEDVVSYMADVYDAQKKLIELQVERDTADAQVRTGLAGAVEAEMNAATAGTNARVAEATAPDEVEATRLANQQTQAAIDKTKAETAKTRGGLGRQEEIAWDGLRQLMQSNAYTLALETDPAQAAEMRAEYQRAFGMEGAPPVGVPAVNWYNLTPAEQEEFLRESTGPRIRN